MQNVYTADFETHASIKNQEQKKTGVWLWDICKITTLEHTTGELIEDFLTACANIAPCIIYFHNLKFDGTFILDYLLKNGYTHTYNKSLNTKEFTTLITDMGIFYSIKICFKGGNKKKSYTVEFRDSSKKVAGSVERIAKSYGLPICKLSIDYTLDRENYTVTEEDIQYIHNDTEIMAIVLKDLYTHNMDRLTTSSDTFNLYRKMLGVHYKTLFPIVSLEIDDFIRASYRGGVTQVNEQLTNQWLTTDYVYDINSMYPYQMCNKILPFGIPIYYKGKYTYDRRNPLYVQRVRVCCKVKEKHRPTVLMNNARFNKNYLTDTGQEMQELTLTSVDLELLLKHYNIFDIQYIDGYKMQGSTKLFDRYLLPIYNKKCNSKGAEKERNKLLLNGLYGKMAMNPRHAKKEPYLNTETQTVEYKVTTVEIDKPVYTAVASFITAYARQQLFSVIQDNIDNFIYCDTDSVHLTKPLTNAEIHHDKLGAWKHETENKKVLKSYYIGAKSYMLIFEDGTRELKIAGCPPNVKNIIKEETFKIGNTFDGKLMPKRVNGGTILYPRTFTIKKR